VGIFLADSLRLVVSLECAEGLVQQLCGVVKKMEVRSLAILIKTVECRLWCVMYLPLSAPPHPQYRHL